MCGSVVWRPVTSISGETADRLYNDATRLNWNVLRVDTSTDKSTFNYFQLRFPVSELSSLVPRTGCSLQSLQQKSPSDTTLSDTNRGELLRLIGTRLVVALMRSHESVEAYWSSAVGPDTVVQGGNFGQRFGMSRHRFQSLERAVAFGPSSSVSILYIYIYI